MKPYNYKSLKAFVYHQMYEHYITCITRWPDAKRMDYQGWCEVDDVTLRDWFAANGYDPFEFSVTVHNLKAKILKMLEKDGLLVKKAISKNEAYDRNYEEKSWNNPMVIYKYATPIEIAQRKIK